MNFNHFKQAVDRNFADMQKGELYTVEMDRDELWNIYLSSFPEGSDPIYKTNTQHNCNCCKNYIRDVGHVVSIVNGQLRSIWDVNLNNEPEYEAVAKALAAHVRTKPINSFFRHEISRIGVDHNFQLLEDGQKRWDHFHSVLDSRFVSQSPSATANKLNESKTMLERACSEISDEALQSVFELIESNSIYRGETYKHLVASFMRFKYDLGSAKDPMIFWAAASQLGDDICRIRNTAIGTLLVDISSGMELADAVRRFEAMVAPANYKRPTALVTKSMIDAAKKTIEELGYMSSLERRYATLDDIDINNLLFADRTIVRKLSSSPFDDIAPTVRAEPMKFDKIESVSIETFIEKILPTAKMLEIMVENKHAGNFVSLIAPANTSAKPMFKWDNPFSWSYTGDVADAMKARVKNAGGCVEGDVRISLAWDYTDDLDLHVQEPNELIYYGHRRSANGGFLDVDANGMNGMMKEPVENVVYPSIFNMKNGRYIIVVHNYHRRSSGVNFDIDVEVLGQLYRLTYEGAVKQGERIEVGVIQKVGSQLTLTTNLKHRNVAQDIWGVETGKFVKVNALMRSPNYWGTNGIGNLHYFFMLDGCKNDSVARGFYNEFLSSELDKHRRAMELVGSKMLTDKCKEQLSGLGFSNSLRNTVTCRVTGATTRIININF